MALEQRFRTAVLFEGGLYLSAAAPPETDPLNFLPRARVPVLMLNGRYDYTFPVDSSQKPFFRWLGTPEKDKRHVLYDAAHDVMVNRTEVVKEVLSWLDQYLEPVVGDRDAVTNWPGNHRLPDVCNSGSADCASHRNASTSLSQRGAGSNSRSLGSSPLAWLKSGRLRSRIDSREFSLQRRLRSLGGAIRRYCRRTCALSSLLFATVR
jgi:hypothetical protein